MRRHEYASVILLLLGAVMAPACRRDVDPLHRLLRTTSELEERPTTARIAALPYAPAAPRARAVRGIATPSAAVLRVRLAAAEILNDETVSTHAQAVALLVSGRTEEAVRALMTLTEQSPSNAMYWSDLAAARYEMGNERDDPALHVGALAAADASLRVDPDYAPALFNRGLALEALGLGPYAVRAFKHYGSIDSTSGWSHEASGRVREENAADGAAAWSRMKADLEKGRDVASIVRQFPQQTRSFAESDYLSRWADAHIAGDADAATHWLHVAQVIANAQLAIRGERLLSDAIAAIENAQDRTTLARTHVTYRQGRLFYSTGSARISEALPLLHQAEQEFARAGSPMALVAAYYHANALFDAHRADTAQKIITRLQNDAPQPYRALHAQLEWLKSTMAANAGQPYAALTAALTSASHFRELGESEHAARMEMAASRTLDRLGRSSEAYRLRKRAFESASAAGKASLWEALLNSAARYEVKAEHWDAAVSFFALELENPPVSPLLRFDALLWRSVAEAKIQGGSTPDLREARAAAARAVDPAMRADMETELQFVEGISMTNTDPNRACELLTRVIEARIQNARVSNLAFAYRMRARGHSRMKRLHDQESDLRHAIDCYEQQAGGIERDDLKDAFSGTTIDAYAELTELLLQSGRPSEAFEVAERARARGLLAFESRRRPSKPLSLQALARLVEPDVVVVHYTAVRAAMLIAVIEADEYRIVTAAVKPEELASHARRLTSAILNDDSSGERVSARWLYDHLVTPIGPIPEGRTLVIVTDDILDQVPFAVLISPSGRYLVEDIAIVRAPNARIFTAHADEKNAAVDHHNLALIADPTIDTATFPTLERLPGARADIQRLAAGHRTIILSDRAATPERVIGALRSATGAHISAHALTDETDAWKSLFVLAPDGKTDGALYLHEIAKLDLSRLRVVTLAGCRTSVSGGNSGSVNTMARAFIAAGSHNVIGTLWDVDDSLTSRLTADIDTALHMGQLPAEALRRVQVAALRSGKGRHSASRHWAAFQLQGCNH